jgi:pentatricopeptide repeat protein
MISKGHDTDVKSYTALIDGFGKKGEIEKANDFLHGMSARRNKPNVVSPIFPLFSA